MKTNNDSNTNGSYVSESPQYYLNGIDRSQLGILSLAPDIKEYWSKVGKGLTSCQQNLTVFKTKNDKILVLAGQTCIGFINGKDLDPAKISSYLRAGEMVFTLIGEDRNVDQDMAMFG